MHNLISRNQLDEWRHFEDTVDSIDSERENDYYECLIDCVDAIKLQTYLQGDTYVRKPQHTYLQWGPRSPFFVNRFIIREYVCW